MAECLEVVVPKFNMGKHYIDIRVFYNAMISVNEVIGFAEHPKLSLLFDERVHFRLKNLQKRKVVIGEKNVLF